MKILGISGLYHDSAACLTVDGKIVAAAQEERFSRVKHDCSFPEKSISFCLRRAGITEEDLDFVVFYEDSEEKRARIDETIASFSVKYDLYRKIVNSQEKKKKIIDSRFEKLISIKHHTSHAASAFYPSPFHSAVIVTIDGVGERETTTISVGIGNKITKIKSINFPDSLGILYSAFTEFCGFKVNFGEYKLMGLAPYGSPIYFEKILEELVDVRSDGSFSLNLECFDYHRGEKTINENFENVFGFKKRQPESKIEKKYCDIAASIQKVTEMIVESICLHAKQITGMENICLAGGVALNCVSNGNILRKKIFKNMWIQPAAGDAGGAIGAALYYYYQVLGNQRVVATPDAMNSALLGPEYSKENIRRTLLSLGANFKDCDPIIDAAKLLSKGNVVGWFQGRMEFGPRALGNRSILGDPRCKTMQSKMNLKIKHRESFRPFAPSVLSEKCSDYFNLDEDSPYMMLVANVKKDQLKTVENLSFDKSSLNLVDIVNQERSTIPAVTHVDNSARVQTVNYSQNSKFYNLLKEFDKITGCPVLINTSFNVRGEPIVCSPEDAYNCFMLTDMDYLVVGDFVLSKEEQKQWSQTKKQMYLNKFELD